MPLTLGATARGSPVSLTSDERLRHLHVVGASGSGKSKFLEHLIRQDIGIGRGLCLIDPHGTLADNVVAWCASRRIDRHGRRIHIITPSDLQWAAGFNPLRLDHVVEPQARVDAMVAACAEVWGGEDTSKTPLLKRYLKAVFYVLAVHKLTLLEAVELITSRNLSTVRRALTRDLPDYVYDAQWEAINAMSSREFAEQFSSTNNRLMEFLSSPVMRRVVGQRDRVLDFAEVMDRGDIVIVNLAERGAISRENGPMLGALIASELFLLAKTRSPEAAKRRPFTLYIDECYQFLTGDIEQMLAQTRKFGLSVVLAHQWLRQLGHPDSPTYRGVMAGAQTKIIFGGLEDEEAEVMAKQMFRSAFRLDRPKRELDRFEVVDEVPFWLESESTTDSEGVTATTGRSSSSAHSGGSSEGVATAYEDDGYDPHGRTERADTSASWNEQSAESASDSKTRGSSYTRGRSQTLKPVRRLVHTAFYTLEEQLHLAIRRLRELPQQTAIVRRQGHPPVTFTPPTVRMPLVSAAAVANFIERTRSASTFISERDLVEAEIAERQAQLQARAQPVHTGDDAFWAEEEA